MQACTVKINDKVGYSPRFLRKHIGSPVEQHDMWTRRGTVYEIGLNIVRVRWDGSGFEEPIDPRYLELLPEMEPTVAQEY